MQKEQKKVGLILAEGFEEIEAITVIDCLRRVSLKVDTISLTESLEVLGGHNIKVTADVLFDAIDLCDYDCIVTPGGLLGTENMLAHQDFLNELTRFYHEKNRIIASICASPLVLGKIGLANFHKGTAYPSFLDQIGFKETSNEVCIVDGKIITAIGPAASFAFAYQIIASLLSLTVAEELAETMQYKRLLAK